MNMIKARNVVLAGWMLGAALFGAAPVEADYQVIDGTTHLIPFKAFACTTGFGTGVCPGYVPMDTTGNPFGVPTNPFFVAPVQDVRPNVGVVTTQDTGSSSTSGQNSVAIITGTPSANSTFAQAINGQAIARVQLSGIWTGTLAFEGSVDNGVTWVAQPARVTGTSFTGSTAALNGEFLIDTSGLTNIRVRATAVMTGTVAVTFTFAANPGAVQVLNPVRLFDNLSGAQATVKPANTPPSSTDTAIVVVPSPNSVNNPPSLGTSGGWTRTLFAGLSTTVQTVKASAGQIGKLYCDNPTATAIYVETFDVSGTVTLGTTAPTQAYMIPANNAAGFSLSVVGDQYENAIKIAAVTAENGSTAPATPGNCNVSWN